MAFGTVEAWSYAIMEIMIGFSALLLLLPHRQTTLYRVPGLVPLLLIAAYLAMQVVPLPPFLVRIISPEAYQIYHQTAGAAGNASWMPLSIHSRATFFELTRFLSYLVFYVVAVHLFTDRALLKRALVVISVFAGMLSLLVIIQFITRHLNYDYAHDKIFWIRESVHGSGSIGPYVNRNHYAGLMEMLFPLMLSLFLIYRPKSSAAAWKMRLKDFLGHPRINYHFLYGVTALLIGTSVFVSLSRGGITALTLSMGALSIWLMRKAKSKKAGLIAVVLFAGILVLTGSSGWDRIFKRFSDIRTASGELNTGRLHYWRDGRSIIADFPLTGSGAGTWQDIYPRYRTFPGSARLEHAHSDYVEFMATGGVILVSLLTLALCRIIFVSFRSYRRRRKRMAVYLFAACLTAVLSILLHSFVDFNLQVGANGLCFFFVLAVMVSAAHTRFHNGAQCTYLPEVKTNYRRSRLAALAFFIAVLVSHGGVLLANYHFFDFQETPLTPDISDQNLQAFHQAAERAAFFDPLNAKYFHVVANTSVMLDKPDAARRHYQRAIRLSPLDGQILQDAGLFFSRQGNIDAADLLLRTAVECSSGDVRSHLSYAAVLFEHERGEEGLDILRSLMSADPGATDACLALMAWLGVSEERMRQALPHRVKPYLAFGDYLASMGHYGPASAAYLDALSFVDREETVGKKTFMYVYRFLKHNREKDKALEVVMQAMIYFPDDTQLKRIVAHAR